MAAGPRLVAWSHSRILTGVPIMTSRVTRFHGAAALALAGAAVATAASAHVIAGDRIFPVTLTFDDPGVGDEATLPQVIWQPDAGRQNLYQLQWEYDKTITPTTALIYNHGFDYLQAAGRRTTAASRTSSSPANGRRTPCPGLFNAVG
jgi:hypothetical protein